MYNRTKTTTRVFRALLAAAALAGCGRSSPAPGRTGQTAGAQGAAGGGQAHRSAERPAERAPASKIRFRQAGAETGIRFVHSSGNSPEKHFPTSNGSGVAIFDYDNDGLMDLYFATTRNFPLDAPSASQGNALYRNKGSGKFEDVTQASALVFRGFTHGVAAGDVNNDGFTDLYLANYGGNKLYMNNGDGTFRDVTSGSGAAPPCWSTAAAFLDYDNDGFLDLYVSCYGEWSPSAENPYCGDKAKGVRTYCSQQTIKPARHFLLHNKRDGTFEDASERAGVLRTDGRGMGVVATDFNNDGKIDIYVANDQCPNFLFLNRGDGTFRDAGELSGAARAESGETFAGMGVDAEDIDGDGLAEIFVTNFREEPNTLFKNIDGETFIDISASSGIVKDSLPDVGWGCGLVDLDADGRPDMIALNGHIDDNLESLGKPTPQAELSKIWRNAGDCKFRRVLDAGPFFAAGHVARGASFGDLDNDGDLDIVVSLMDAAPAILWNEHPRASWIRISLEGALSNRQGIGATIKARIGQRTIVRRAKGGGSYLASNDPRILIEFDWSDRAQEIEIRWPSGRVSTLRDAASGAELKVREPNERPSRIE